MEAVDFNPSTQPSISSKAEPSGSIGGEYKAYFPLYDHFNLPTRSDERVNRQLDMIWSYAKNQAKQEDRESVLWEVTKLRHKLGDTSGGTAAYSKILSYISTVTRMKEAEQMIKEMERHV